MSMVNLLLFRNRQHGNWCNYRLENPRQCYIVNRPSGNQQSTFTSVTGQYYAHLQVYGTSKLPVASREFIG